MDVCFVSVPFVPLERPLISFGVLQSELKKNNFSVKTIYSNFDFALQIGLKEYVSIVYAGSGISLGDWIFAKYLFPDNKGDKYLDYLKQNYPILLSHLPMIKNDMDIRSEACEYIEKTADDILTKYNPKIIACSSMFDQHTACLSLLKCIKKKSPQTITLLGGANCEDIMGVTNHQLFDFVDFLISGHGDYLIAGLVEKILHYGIDIEKEQVPGQVLAPVFRKKGYPDLSEHLKPAIHKLNSIPDYDDYFEKFKEFEKLEEYKNIIYPTIPIETSRGCYWGKCTFCGLNGHNLKYHSKKEDEIVNEINYLTLKYNYTNKVEFVDNAINVKIFKKLLKKIQRKNLLYFAEIRSDLKKEELSVLYSNGFIWLQPGIENLSDNFLQHMNKGTNVLQNLQILKWSVELGIVTVWSIMHYFPKENNKWYSDLIKLIPKITHLVPPGSLNRLRYDRFSEYHNNQKKYNLELQAQEHYRYIYPFDMESLNNLVYFFEDKQDIEYRKNPLLKVLIGDPKFELVEVDKLIQEWILCFNSKKSTLSYSIDSKGLATIKDTRKIACQNTYMLNHTESAILRFCDEYKTEEQIINAYQPEYSVDEINNAIQSLINYNLLIDNKNSYLTIALTKPAATLPSKKDFPCGWIDIGALH